MADAYTIKKHHGKYNIVKRVTPIKFIVIHYVGSGDSSAGSALANCKYFAGGNRNASAHYFIDDSSIYEYANPSKHATWHCGDGKGKYKVDGIAITNANSIGIEVCINGNKPFTEEETKRLTWLVQKLMKEYKIPAQRVVRHYDASRKQCPLYYVKNPSKWTELHKRITSGIITETKTTENKTTTKEVSTVAVNMSILKQGSTGHQVKVLQRLLIAAGYSCGSYGADGDFGAGTAKAVKAFQKANKLDQDAVVGANTWKRLLRGD